MRALLLLLLAGAAAANPRRMPPPGVPADMPAPRVPAPGVPSGPTVLTPGAPAARPPASPSLPAPAARPAPAPSAPASVAAASHAPAPAASPAVAHAPAPAPTPGPIGFSESAASARAARLGEVDRALKAYRELPPDAPAELRAAHIDRLYTAARESGLGIELAVGADLKALEAREAALRSKPFHVPLWGESMLAGYWGTDLGIVLKAGPVPRPRDVRVHGRILEQALPDFVNNLPGLARSLWSRAVARVSGGEAPRRLVVGEGRAPLFQRPGDVTMDLDPAARPHVVGDVAHPPFADRSFSEIYWERLPFDAFTGDNAGAISQAHRLLRPGGRLLFLTGRAAPWGELLRDLQAAGFVQIVRRRDGSVSARKATVAEQAARG